MGDIPPESPEGKPYTFPDTPLGMSSAYDAAYLPYQEGHTIKAEADDPILFNATKPDYYSDNPLDFYQWWANVSDWVSVEPGRV